MKVNGPLGSRGPLVRSAAVVASERDRLTVWRENFAGMQTETRSNPRRKHKLAAMVVVLYTVAENSLNAPMAKDVSQAVTNVMETGIAAMVPTKEAVLYAVAEMSGSVEVVKNVYQIVTNATEIGIATTDQTKRIAVSRVTSFAIRAAQTPAVEPVGGPCPVAC